MAHLASKTVSRGEAYGALPGDPVSSTKPTWTGYTFAGWIGPGDSEITADSIVEIGQDHAAEASWIPQVSAVSYNANKGEINEESPIEMKFGEPLVVPAPTRSGYVFIGWMVTTGLDRTMALWGVEGDVSQAIPSSGYCCNGPGEDVVFLNLNARGTPVGLKAFWAKPS